MTFKTAVVDNLKNEKTTTDNGMKSRVSSASELVDLFNVIGSSRGSDLTNLFYAALATDEDKTIRTLLWARDILQGAGEREQFRNLLQKLEEHNYKLAGRLIPKIPDLGRWDDLFYFKNGANIAKAFDFYGEALKNGNALAAKWAPREKSAKRDIAYAFRKHLKMQPKEYRKLLVSNTQVVETKMCADDWSDINFSHVPSIAAFRYQAAFERHVPEKYEEYTNALESGDLVDGKAVKVNAKTLYPHDVIMSILRGHTNVAYAQWEALPNYCGDTKILPLVDVSLSMGVFNDTRRLQAIHSAVSLGLYIADKTTSAFKDMFLTFTRIPQFVSLTGDLQLKMSQMCTADWGQNTNLEAALISILDVAVNNKIKQEDMPEFLLILSDMQFDQACKPNATALKTIKHHFKSNGYEMPKVVFWNLSHDIKSVSVKFNKIGVAMISGFSPAIMESVLSNDLEQFSPENVMLNTIMSERYNY